MYDLIDIRNNARKDFGDVAQHFLSGSDGGSDGRWDGGWDGGRALVEELKKVEKKNKKTKRSEKKRAEASKGFPLPQDGCKNMFVCFFFFFFEKKTCYGKSFGN